MDGVIRFGRPLGDALFMWHQKIIQLQYTDPSRQESHFKFDLQSSFGPKFGETKLQDPLETIEFL